MLHFDISSKSVALLYWIYHRQAFVMYNSCLVEYGGPGGRDQTLHESVIIRLDKTATVRFCDRTLIPFRDQTTVQFRYRATNYTTSMVHIHDPVVGRKLAYHNQLRYMYTHRTNSALLEAAEHNPGHTRVWYRHMCMEFC